MKEKKLVFGVGVCDINSCDGHGKKLKSYAAWTSMIRRCYSSKYHEKYPSYIGCSVCDEWKTYSNFKKFYEENYRDGLAMDKDILIQGNKVYSPETCTFVPQYINNLLIHNRKNNSSGFVGVCWNKRDCKWRVSLAINGKQKHIGYYSTLEDASEAYIQAKTNQIKEVALEALNKGDIDTRTYNALLKYKI